MLIQGLVLAFVKLIQLQDTVTAADEIMKRKRLGNLKRLLMIGNQII